MNINNIFIPTDIWFLILAKLKPIDYVNVIKTNKNFYKLSLNRNLYLNQKLHFARFLLRCTYGPIYLIQKYNDLELLQHYLKILKPSEPYQFKCKDNIVLYNFLIINNINNIIDLDHSIFAFDDVDNYHKYKNLIREDPFDYHCPPRICQSLLPIENGRVKRQRANYSRLISHYRIKQLLDCNCINLLNYCYDNWSGTVLTILNEMDISYSQLKVASLQWLKDKIYYQPIYILG